MRLIDADELYDKAEEKYKDSSGFYRPIYRGFVDDVASAPTVDAVEVVRCKGCKFYTESENRCDHPYMDYDVECYDQWLVVNPDDFCSCGERRSDHETDKSG